MFLESTGYRLKISMLFLYSIDTKNNNTIDRFMRAKRA